MHPPWIYRYIKRRKKETYGCTLANTTDKLPAASRRATCVLLIFFWTPWWDYKLAIAMTENTVVPDFSASSPLSYPLIGIKTHHKDWFKSRRKEGEKGAETDDRKWRAQNNHVSRSPRSVGVDLPSKLPVRGASFFCFRPDITLLLEITAAVVMSIPCEILTAFERSIASKHFEDSILSRYVLTGTLELCSLDRHFHK